MSSGGSVKVEDKSGRFIVASADAMDKALNKLAADIERLAKLQVPKDTGALQSSGRHERKGFMNYIVTFSAPYARRWHFETPPGGFQRGRKSMYLADPARKLFPSLPSIIESYVRRLRV